MVSTGRGVTLRMLRQEAPRRVITKFMEAAFSGPLSAMRNLARAGLNAEAGWALGLGVTVPRQRHWHRFEVVS